MICKIIDNILRLNFNYIKKKLIVIFTNGTQTEIDMSIDEYENMIKNGDFNIIKEKLNIN